MKEYQISLTKEDVLVVLSSIQLSMQGVSKRAIEESQSSKFWIQKLQSLSILYEKIAMACVDAL